VRVSCTHYCALYSDQRVFINVTKNEKTPDKTRNHVANAHKKKKKKKKKQKKKKKKKKMMMIKKKEEEEENKD
jgi:hypothetical protein